MNMTDMINNMSEETMISLALFTGAAIIYVIRKFGSMNQQLLEYEENDISGRESFIREVELLNNIRAEIRQDFEDPNNHVEEELVKHEMIGFTMAPKIKKLNDQITNVLDGQSDALTEVTTNIESISGQVEKVFNHNQDNSLEDINNMIPQLVSKIEAVNESVKGESQNVALLLNEVLMIKRTLGVE